MSRKIVCYLLPVLALGALACGDSAGAAPSAIEADASVLPDAAVETDAGEAATIDAGEVPDGCDLEPEPCAEALSLRLPAALPPARGNSHGDNEAAATLGFRLFFDSDLGTGVGCVTCHAPEFAFTDRRSISKGKADGTRNAPTTLNAARLNVLLWDGRADSVWSQPLLALENPLEMASTRLALAQRLETDTYLRPFYEQTFGPLPDMSGWPDAGKPGDAAFDNLSKQTQAQVNLVAANVGKAFEAYMRKQTAGPGPLDGFLAGDASLIGPEAKNGLRVFIGRGCVTCHSGPMLTDERFHDVGFPSLPDALPDLGRPPAIAPLMDSAFNLAGAYADEGTPGAGVALVVEPAEAGAFRTPSLRNIARTAPYGHDGAVATLGELLSVHASTLTELERGYLLAFFQSLTGALPPRPWNNWPSAQ